MKNLSKAISYSSLAFTPFFTYGIDLYDFMQEVYEKSPYVMIDKHHYEAAKTRLLGQNSYFIPKIKSESYQKVDTVTGEDTNKINLNISSLVYSSDQKHNMSKAEYEALNAENALLSKFEGMKYNIIKNTIEIREYQKLLSIVDTLINDTSVLKNRIKMRVEGGTSIDSDLSQVNLLLSRIENEVNFLTKKINVLKLNTVSITGLDYPDSDIILPENYISKLKAYEADPKNLTNNLEYQSLDYQVAIAKNDMQKEDPLFNITLDGDYNNKNEYNEWSDEFSIALNVNVNIFDYQAGLEKGALAHNYQASIVERDVFFKKIEANLEEFNYLNKTFSAELANFEYQIDQSEAIVSEQEKLYNIGKVSLYEMLNTRFDLFSQKINRTKSFVSFLQNKVDIAELVREFN